MIYLETTRQFLPDNYKVVERGEIEVKGKGSMKTYWLDYRENRRTLAQAAADVTANRSPVKAIEYNNHDRRMSMPQYMLHNKSAENSSDERRVYSPITFEDVARRSVVHSPMRSLFSGHGGRVSRSNSTGHAFLQSPSDVFGSLIVDTEEFLEDLHNRNSAGPSSNLLSPTSAPMSAYSQNGSKNLRQISARIKNKKAAGQVSFDVIDFLMGGAINLKQTSIQFTDDEILKLNQRQPSPSAPVLQKSDSKDSSKGSEKDRSIMKRGSRFSQADSEKRALENLDEMVKNVYDNDIPGMCWPSPSPTSQPQQQPSNSKSEGNLRCLQNPCK